LGSTRPLIRALKQRPDIGAVATAGLANEFRLQIGQANVVAPLGGVDHDGMRAFEVAAVDDQPRGPFELRISPKDIF
jgi:hypothetical protein